MCRRFAFTPLHPSDQPTAAFLTKWLAKRGHPQTLTFVLDSLNCLIKDEDLKIGPFYFMRDAVQTDAGLLRA